MRAKQQTLWSAVVTGSIVGVAASIAIVLGSRHVGPRGTSRVTLPRPFAEMLREPPPKENLVPWAVVRAASADARQLIVAFSKPDRQCTGARVEAFETPKAVTISLYLRGLHGVHDGIDCDHRYTPGRHGHVAVAGVEFPGTIALTLAQPLGGRTLVDAGCLPTAATRHDGYCNVVGKAAAH